MKHSEMTRELQSKGCKFSKHGRRHDEWISPSGKTLYIPRHPSKEVPTGTYKQILKEAGL